MERDVNGNLLDEAKCEMCNGNTPALSVPNSSGDRYVPIPYSRNTDTSSCFIQIHNQEVDQGI